MAVVIEKPSLLQRVIPFLRGFDWPLITIILFMAAIGLFAMYSLGFDHGARFAQHSRNMLIGAGVMLLFSQIPPQRLMSLALPLYLAGVVLLLGVEFAGIMRKGAQRWLDVGVIVIQPSEIMKIAMPMMLAWWFHRREGQLKATDFAVAGVLLAVPATLILLQPDLGTTLLVVASGMAVIFFAGLSWKLIVPPVLLAVIGIGVLIANESSWCAPGVDWQVLHEYQRQRVCTLLDPTKDPLGKGFHIIQGVIAIGSGGVWGKGFMQGTQTHLEFIPERTTDFAFAGFSEEFGLMGVLLLLAGFIALIVRGLIIAAEAPTLFSRLLAGALTLNIFVYAFVNMGMVSGILPVVGVPLPFVSYGGTAMVTLGVGLGMLLAISRAKRLIPT
jgi:rod shape determining protein RodA